jgi:hypothetical protein
MSRTTTEAINSYVTDMIALEDHLDKAIRGQIEDFEDERPAFTRYLRDIQTQIQQHISVLRGLANRRQVNGGGIAEAIKRVASSVAGAGAALIDIVRNEKLPKDLRDDYTAVNLAVIGYAMLHTTAVALNDEEVAEIARSHMTDYAHTVMVLQKIIPQAVLDSLREDGLPARQEVLGQVDSTFGSVWQQARQGVPDADHAFAH